VAADALAVYREHCASCHGTARLGGMGPALLPENLGRLKREDAAEVIAHGRTATQMPAFGDQLDDGAIGALVELIYTPLPELPAWEVTDIEASREVLVAPTALADAPRYDADPLNLFVVVEAGDHHVTILDGDRFEPMTRFPSRFALHGGPKFSPDGRFVYFASRDGDKAAVVHLDVRREIAELPLPGLPHLGSGISWELDGRRVLATPHLKDGAVSVIDMADWRVIKRIETLGPGFFMRSHENTPYAWVDVFFGPDRDAVHVLDKRTLEIVATLRPAQGKTAAHVEFTRDGRYALLSIWDTDGALVVYDAETLDEVTRIPMVKPSGKYNVWNKIHGSEGTSH
jgi:hypothetical protein